MLKKALVLASVASMIDQFNMPNIEILQSLGYQVDVVADFVNPGTISAERAEDLQKRLYARSVRVFPVVIPRSMNLVRILSAYKKVKKIIYQENYDLIHCHSPIGGVIGRTAAAAGKRKKGTRVIYTAHGFHFYKGAPLKNWLIYYPVEWICSFFTDVLITINQEDYALAKKHLHAGKVSYIPGVGVDIEKFKNVKVDREEKRKEIGIPRDAFLLFSVGELNENKNHITVIRAVAEINDPQIHYMIAGRGILREYLIDQIRKLQLEDQVHLLGFRCDIPELLKISDAYLLPSIREGLNVSLMEAMASGLPVVASKVRGNVDLIENGVNGYLIPPNNHKQFGDAIYQMKEDKKSKVMGKNNARKMLKYDKKQIKQYLYSIYKDCEVFV